MQIGAQIKTLQLDISKNVRSELLFKAIIVFA